MANTVLQNFVTQNRKITWTRDNKYVLEYTRWERVRMAFEELGATFIKLAQVLSNRPDILPDALLMEFQKLQSDVPPFSVVELKAIVERELGNPITETFDFFDEHPIGSASIGQVHLATLKNGDEVVVKVQRPNVKILVETDLSILKEVVRRAEGLFESFGIMSPMDVVVAFEKSMSKEMDYNNEARNISSFRNFYKKNKLFYVPKAYKEFSTDKILVLERISGCKITDVEQLKEWGLEPPKIAEIGLDIYLTQIFKFGYFHADPHPGNVLVRSDGVICLIDFGMVGRMMKKEKFTIASLFVDMAQQNAKGMAKSLKRLAIDDEIEDLRRLEYDLNELIEDLSDLDVSESNIADMVNRLQGIIYTHRIRVPGSIFLIMRALAILEGIGKTIHPNLNVFEFVAPYGRDVVLEMYSPENIVTDSISVFNDFASLLYEFPYELKDITKKLRQGKIHTNLTLTGYEQILKKLERLGNHLTLSLVISALLLSSAIIMTADLDPSIKTSGGIPYLSIGGFVTAGVFAIVLWVRSITGRK